MKKISLFTMAAIAVAAISCQKDISAPADSSAVGTVTRSFSVTAPAETKTTLDSDGLTIKWAAGDEINVIGITDEGTVTEHTFTLKSGAGTASAVFSGDVNADETTFYAVYPNVAIDKTIISASASSYIQPVKKLNNASDVQTAVPDGFDSNYAFMTAVADASGNFAFRHGVAYFKIKIGVEDVVNVNIKSSGSRFYGRPKINAGDGSFNNIDSAQDNINLAPSAGVLAKDGIYYIPVQVKNSNLGNITVTYTFSDAVKADVTTGKFSGKIALGTVYDLGCPPVSKPTGPVVTLLKTSVSDVEPAASSGLSIVSAYSISNGDDSDVTVTCDGVVVTSASISGGTVTYSVSENTGSSRSGWIGLQVGEGEVQKIAVNQKESASITLTAVSTTTTWGSAEFTALKTEKGTDAISGDFIDSNMKFICGGKIKFGSSNSTPHCQLGGAGSATSVCMQIMVSGNGKLSFEAAASGDNTDRYLVVSNGSSEQGRVAIPKKSEKVSDEISVTAVSGDVISIFSSKGSINVYSITWTPAS